jgi:xanthine dehydrogenase small subunit
MEYRWKSLWLNNIGAGSQGKVYAKQRTHLEAPKIPFSSFSESVAQTELFSMLENGTATIKIFDGEAGQYKPIADAVKFSMRSATAGLQFVLNGETVRENEIVPQVTLLDYIRGRGLTGAKEGCAEGECGACAVLFVTPGEDGSAYQAVNSCLVPLPAASGHEVYTVESLNESGKLCEAQRAMVERGGSQCGYCTPGFVVSMFAEQFRRHRTGFDLGGNLCRCTGYRPIRDAMQSLGHPPDTALRRRMALPAPQVLPLHYESACGRFSRPCSLAQCLKLAADDRSGQFVAGNTDLGVMTNLRHRRFPHLISLDGIPELREFRDGPDMVEIGAGLTLTEIGERWTAAPDLFRDWLRLFASPLIRNRATLGGNLATASPIGDSAPLLLALDAELRISGIRGERTIPLNSFFRAYRQTALETGEVIRSVRIPKPLPAHARFYKVAKRRVDDISTVAAGIAIRTNDSGRTQTARIAFGGVAPIPLRVVEAEKALAAGDPAGAKDMLRRMLRPIGDHRGSAPYRLAMAQSLLDKFVWSVT